MYGQIAQLALMGAAPIIKHFQPKPPTPEEMIRRLFAGLDTQMSPMRHGLFAAEANAAAGMRQNLSSMMGRYGAGGTGMGMAAGGLANSQFGTSLARSETEYRNMVGGMVSSMMGSQGDAGSWVRPNNILGGYAQLLGSPDFAQSLNALVESLKGRKKDAGQA